MRTPAFPNLTIIGCGLLGGSLAAAWRHAGCVGSVTGYDRDSRTLARAVELGIVDRAAPSLAAAVGAADCIALALPVCAISASFAELAQHAPPGAICTDVGSTKVGILAAARQGLGSRYALFVPGHPIAGGALPGVEQARKDLFDARWVITTPDGATDPAALERVELCWRACGASIERMSAAEHDRIFAAVSHLPHLIAFVLMHQLASQADGARKLRFAGAGFRDFTRIAASDPAMWRDIALANREALLGELQNFRSGLDELQAALAAGDGVALDALFEQASRARRAQNFAPGATNAYDD